MLRGRISFASATREAFRRGRAAVRSRRERSMLDELAAQPARLGPEFQNLSATDLLRHFHERTAPSFFPGFEHSIVTAQRHQDLFPDETGQLLESARAIINEHRWPLLGFGEQDFGREINWHRDLLSGRIWPLDYHADIPLWHDDGSDIRVLWELNRLGHLITLGRAYALTKEEEIAVEFFAQLDSWRRQNPVARGANWSCAMEVALRAMNLFAAFCLFRDSRTLSEERLLMLLTMFDQHGAYIRRNLEFSHVTTSNHYLSDVVGLLWLAMMLPELAAAKEWRDWALSEMLREMDKQILPDGVDYEASTGYHCFVLELFLYSFLLCRAIGITIEDGYWRKLRSMIEYLRAILRPDGLVPLIGDSDGSRALPITARNANDRAYLLALGAVAFDDSQFKQQALGSPPELLWLFGEEGLQNYEQLTHSNKQPTSQAFPEAGTYVQRHDDLYLLFNANGAKNGRPASHRHNDALSIEISACGRAFVVDPGTCVYTADLHERHQFRSTRYHSTLEIDEVEQSAISEDSPFATGSEARVKVLVWETHPDYDRVVAEHYGYQRLTEGVTHRRTVIFNRPARWWLIEDEILGPGKHKVSVRFHFDAGLDVRCFGEHAVAAIDEISGTQLLICPIKPGELAEPALESQFVSRHYGSKLPSITATWSTSISAPSKLRWAIIPVCAGENPDERLTLGFGPWTLD